MPKPPPGVKTGKTVFCAGVLGQQRGGERAAVAHDGGGVVRHHGLSAQDAMLVGERQADDLEPVLLDPTSGRWRRPRTARRSQQRVALHEAVPGSLFR